MRVRLLSLTVALSSFVSVAAHAQGGKLDSCTQFQMMHGPGMMATPAPLLGIVLWRGEPDWVLPKNDAERRQIDSIMLAAQVRAQAQDRWAFGSGRAIGIQGRDQRSVIIEGQEFDLARRDSVLIIMVSVPPGSAQRTVRTARIESASAPNLLPKQWSAGDTTFIVHVPYFTQVERLRTYLLQSPEVAAFLR